MFTDEKILIGKGNNLVFLSPKMANRHGLIAGATGTGKTITLKGLAESFSDAGVPVFLADVKGDLSGFIESGQMNDRIQTSIDDMKLSDFRFNAYPTVFWDVFGETGLPVRTTISEMGPMLLSRILDLNDTQTSIMTIIFKIADDMQLLLLDYKDLKEMIKYVSSNANEFKDEYGNISTTSVGAILRKVIVFEEVGADLFFGEEALNIKDLMRVDHDNRGIINVLNSQKLYQYPKLYSTFLLWLISELFEELEEVGDLDKPKMIFFFDEAHLLFDNAPKVLLEKVEQVVRLIRSKGVGIYFVTQNPSDIPQDILGQLGNKIQHALRAFTPNEQKTIKSIAKSFRNDENIDLEIELTNLKVGQALVSVLDYEGRPTTVEKAMIVPPSSKMGSSEIRYYEQTRANVNLQNKYGNLIDRESAYEILKKKVEADTKTQELEAQQKVQEKERLKKEKQASSKKDTLIDIGLKQVTRTVTSQLGRQIGNSIMRGLFGSLTKKK